MPSVKQVAGDKQEAQVAYLLDRAFMKDPNHTVFHNVYLSHGGFNAQIDHLILYKNGFIVVESKSVHGEVKVNDEGEWERSYKNRWYGLPSPLKQGELQIDLLKTVLQDSVSELLGTILGVRKGFGGRRYDVIVAVSSSARIHRKNMPKDLSANVVKTEFLVDRIRQLTDSGTVLKNFMNSEPWFNDNELAALVNFLRNYEVDNSNEPDSMEPQPADLTPERNDQTRSGQAVAQIVLECKHCLSQDDLSPESGRYGYYIRCPQCQNNTALKQRCPRCQSLDTKARKKGPQFYLECYGCGSKANFRSKTENGRTGT